MGQQKTQICKVIEVEACMSPSDVAKYMRVTLSKVREMRRSGRLPLPDWYCSNRPRWYADTIRRWIDDRVRL
jgi:hypothetical protein